MLAGRRDAVRSRERMSWLKDQLGGLRGRERELVDRRLRLDSAGKYAPVSGASGCSYGDLSTFIF